MMLKKKLSLFLIYVLGTFSYIVQAQTVEELVERKCTLSFSVDETTEKQKQDTLKIFTSAEQMPQFPGGEASFMKFISENLKYPSDQDGYTQGIVVIRFVVSKNGSITNAKILRSSEPSFDKEALRVVNSMPKWIPGKQNGKDVDVYYTIPIRFKPRY